MYQLKSLFLNSVIASVFLTVLVTKDQALWASHKVLQSSSTYVKSASELNKSCNLQIDRQSFIRISGLNSYPNLFFSPDSQILAATDQSGGSGLVLFDLGTGKSETIKDRSWAGEVSFSSDGKYMAFGTHGPAAYLMDRQNKSVIPLEGHGRRIGRIRFSPDSRFIATTSLDNQARVFDLSGKLKVTIVGLPPTKWGSAADRDPQITGLSWNSLGQVLVVASGKQFTIWDSKSGEQHTIEKQEVSQTNAVPGMNPILFIPNTNKIIAFSDGKFRILNSDGVELKTWLANDNEISYINFSPNGQAFTSIGPSSEAKNMVVKLWNINGSLLTTLKGHRKNIEKAFFSKDGQCIFTSSLDNTVRLWDISGKELGQISGQSGISLSPDDRYLATVDRDRNILVWKLK